MGSLIFSKPFYAEDHGEPFGFGMRKTAMDASLPVLVVDDSRTMTTIIGNLLRQIGFTDIDQVHDGHSALDRLGEKTYGLVLSDWDMRPMNGTELTQQIRKDPTNSKIPIIMVTAKCDADEAWLCGADGYLTKPFKADDLREKIEEVMARREEELPLAG
jgi:two-component system chemotaxis response regulator CheY